MTQPGQRIVATILGCGSSGGVPRIGNNWGDCDPNEPRNNRRRCSLLITSTLPNCAESTQILIDTGADMRLQLLDANVGHLDAVFYTHEHADHTHGVDDLRVLALSNRKRIDVYFSELTGERLRAAFGYCFTAPRGNFYPPILNGHEIDAGQNITISGAGGDVTVRPVLQQHGDILSFGFKIGGLLYSCDVSDFPKISLRELDQLDTWILDALRPVPHPSHLSLPEALSWIDRVGAERGVLTNMHIDMDYATVSTCTPENIEPAFDGMQIEVRV